MFGGPECLREVGCAVEAWDWGGWFSLWGLGRDGRGFSATSCGCAARTALDGPSVLPDGAPLRRAAEGTMRSDGLHLLVQPAHPAVRHSGHNHADRLLPLPEPLPEFHPAGLVPHQPMRRLDDHRGDNCRARARVAGLGGSWWNRVARLRSPPARPADVLAPCRRGMRGSAIFLCAFAQSTRTISTWGARGGRFSLNSRPDSATRRAF